MYPKSVLEGDGKQIIKECVEYTVSMFSSSPYDFIDNEKDIEEEKEEVEAVIRDTALHFKEICEEIGANFWESIDCCSGGSKIIRKLLNEPKK